MKTQRLAVVLALINLAILLFLLSQNRPGAAQSIAPVLRGHALEIVDVEGRVRASINVEPAVQRVRPNGKTYPETVILRLIDPNGRPEVKLAASEQGSGLGLLGDTDSTFVVLQAEGADSSLKLTNRKGREQVIKP